MSRTARTVSPGIRHPAPQHRAACQYDLRCHTPTGPGIAHAAPIRAGKRADTHRPNTLHHNTAANPAKAPRTACCIGGGIPIPPSAKIPQNAIKTPLRVGHKNNRPGIAPGRRGCLEDHLQRYCRMQYCVLQWQGSSTYSCPLRVPPAVRTGCASGSASRLIYPRWYLVSAALYPALIASTYVIVIYPFRGLAPVRWLVGYLDLRTTSARTASGNQMISNKIDINPAPPLKQDKQVCATPDNGI